jgi:integrase
VGVKVREKIEGSGVWWVFISHKGQRSSKRVGSEKAAQKVAEMIQARLKLGQDAVPKEKPPVPTLGEYYKTFKRVYMDTGLRYSTVDSYDRSFRLYILPRLGTARLDEINRSDVEELIAELTKQDFAKDSIRIVLAALGVLFNHAKEHKLVQDNPASRMGKHYRQSGKVHEEIQPLTTDEVPGFLQAVVEHSPQHYGLFLCAIHTGLRSGEIAGLQWGDVDFNGKFLIVRRSFKLGRISATKTNKIRRVDISDDLLLALQDLRRKRKEQWLAKGQNEVPVWVFCNQAGNPADMQNIRNLHFLKCLTKAGLRTIRFHDHAVGCGRRLRAGPVHSWRKLHCR